MKGIHYLDTIISPTVTEKATRLSEHNKVVFKVHNDANKSSIKNTVAGPTFCDNRSAVLVARRGIENVEQIKNIIPKCDVKVLDGTSSYGALEKPDEFANAVLEFLKE